MWDLDIVELPLAARNKLKYSNSARFRFGISLFIRESVQFWWWRDSPPLQFSVVIFHSLLLSFPLALMTGEQSVNQNSPISQTAPAGHRANPSVHCVGTASLGTLVPPGMALLPSVTGLNHRVLARVPTINIHYTSQGLQHPSMALVVGNQVGFRLLLIGLQCLIRLVNKTSSTSDVWRILKLIVEWLI